MGQGGGGDGGGGVLVVQGASAGGHHRRNKKQGFCMLNLANIRCCANLGCGPILCCMMVKSLGI